MAKVKTTAFLNVFESKLTKLINRIKHLRMNGGDKELINRLIKEAKGVRKTVRNMQDDSDTMRSREDILIHLTDLLKDEHPTAPMISVIDTLRWVLHEK